MKDETKVVHSGRHPERFEGAVNPPVFHASTILSPTLDDYEGKNRLSAQDAPGTYYGRRGTPTTRSLEEAVADIEGGYRAVVYPSGLAACAGALLSFLAAGDHLLMTDTVYGPTRKVTCGVLSRYGVTTTFFDPLIGQTIESLIRPDTRVIYLESPGWLTFEMQDVPAIARAAHRHGITVVIDNTWGTPLYFKPFEHGADVSVQAATKYIVGHSDAMLGTVTCTQEAWPKLRTTTYELGQTAGPDDVYLAQRGLRTMAVRLKQHGEAGLALAQWLSRQPEVERVMHPALPGDPGHAIWKRDYLGCCGLFGVVFAPVGNRSFAAFADGLTLFGIGASWGGYESLIMPANPAEYRSPTPWPHAGPYLRFHAGLEAIDDLIADLEAGFARLRAAL